MIPILYEYNETSFTTKGIARLVDCISCTVNEQRNERYECEFEYPITGKNFLEIREGRIIGVIHSDAKDLQPFDIYKRSLPDASGVVTFYARHLKYRQTNVIIRPYTAVTIGGAFGSLSGYAVNPYFFGERFHHHVLPVEEALAPSTYELKVPSTENAVIKEILDLHGGEIKYDKWRVYWQKNRGSDKGVEVTHGKNLISIRQDKDASEIYNAVAPYWKDSDGNLTTVNDYIVYTQESEIYINPLRPVVMDLSSEFDEAPSQAQLQAWSENHLTQNKPWRMKETLEVDFIQLWQTEEYKLYAPLQTVELCDIVTVIYTELGIYDKLKVVEVTYNVLLERYDKIILGDPETSFAEYLRQ